MSMIEIRIPDIGDFKDVPIIEVHVTPGTKVAVEDPLLTLESDKATLEVPSPQAGTVGEVKVKTGDRVSEGDLIVLLEAEGGAAIPPKEKVKEGAAPPPATDRRATARRPGPMRRSRSRFPTSATSRTCR
jgi:dihydrolipoamide dehydrogenase